MINGSIQTDKHNVHLADTMQPKHLIRLKTCLCYRGFWGNIADYLILELNLHIYKLLLNKVNLLGK